MPLNSLQCNLLRPIYCVWVVIQGWAGKEQVTTFRTGGEFIGKMRHCFIRRPSCIFRVRLLLYTVTFLYDPSRVTPSYSDLLVFSEQGHSFIWRLSCMFRAGSFLHTATFLYVPNRLIPSYGDHVCSEPGHSFIRWPSCMFRAGSFLHTATLYVPSRVIPSYGDLVCSEPGHSFIRWPSCMFRAGSFLHTATLYVPSRVIPSYGDLLVCSDPAHSFIWGLSCIFRAGLLLHTRLFCMFRAGLFLRSFSLPLFWSLQDAPHTGPHRCFKLDHFFSPYDELFGCSRLISCSFLITAPFFGASVCVILSYGDLHVCFKWPSWVFRVGLVRYAATFLAGSGRVNPLYGDFLGASGRVSPLYGNYLVYVRRRWCVC